MLVAASDTFTFGVCVAVCTSNTIMSLRNLILVAVVPSTKARVNYLTGQSSERVRIATVRKPAHYKVEYVFFDGATALSSVVGYILVAMSLDSVNGTLRLLYDRERKHVVCLEHDHGIIIGFLLEM